MYTAYVVDERGEATLARNPDGSAIRFATLGEGLAFVARMRVECDARGNRCPAIAIVPSR